MQQLCLYSLFWIQRNRIYNGVLHDAIFYDGVQNDGVMHEILDGVFDGALDEVLDTIGNIIHSEVLNFLLNRILDGVLDAPIDGVLDAPVGGYLVARVDGILDARVDGVLCNDKQNFKRGPKSITRKSSGFLSDGVPHILLDEVLRTLLNVTSDQLRPWMLCLIESNMKNL